MSRKARPDNATLTDAVMKWAISPPWKSAVPDALQRAGLLSLVDSKARKLDDLSKPEKIYVGNTNLMNALVPRVDIGVARETFFYSQVGKSRCVTYTGVGDFVVDGRWTFEVGGKGKGFSQISDVPDSFVVNDGVSIGRGNKIPLWLFGFLY